MYNNEAYQTARKECIKFKKGAVDVANDELDGIINNSEFARRFFNKSGSWFCQRIKGSLVNDKEASFKPEEYNTLADAYRTLASQLNQFADEIDNASL